MIAHQGLRVLSNDDIYDFIVVTGVEFHDLFPEAPTIRPIGTHSGLFHVVHHEAPLNVSTARQRVFFERRGGEKYPETRKIVVLC